MTEDEISSQDQDEHPHKSLWIRNILFLVLGIMTLVLGSFLLTNKIGPEAIFVLLLWCLPLFVH